MHHVDELEGVITLLAPPPRCPAPTHHVDELDGVLVLLVRLLHLSEDHAVHDSGCSNQGQQVQHRVDVVLHHEAAAGGRGAVAVTQSRSEGLAPCGFGCCALAGWKVKNYTKKHIIILSIIIIIIIQIIITP